VLLGISAAPFHFFVHLCAKGDIGTMQNASMCLNAARNLNDVNFAVWRGDSTKGCYVCDLSDRGPPASWKWQKVNSTNVTSWTGEHVIPALDVSAQTSSDGSTVVLRIVNTAPSVVTTLVVFEDHWSISPKEIRAEVLMSKDLSADNGPSEPFRISPSPLNTHDITLQGDSNVTLNLAPHSYTVVELNGTGTA